MSHLNMSTLNVFTYMCSWGHPANLILWQDFCWTPLRRIWPNSQPVAMEKYAVWKWGACQSEQMEFETVRNSNSNFQFILLGKFYQMGIGDSKLSVCLSVCPCLPLESQSSSPDPHEIHVLGFIPLSWLEAYWKSAWYIRFIWFFYWKINMEINYKLSRNSLYVYQCICVKLKADKA